MFTLNTMLSFTMEEPNALSGYEPATLRRFWVSTIFFELLRNFSDGVLGSRIKGAGLQIGQTSASKECRALDDGFRGERGEDPGGFGRMLTRPKRFSIAI
ncbi:hypothetical protein [Agrobacterium pusense]|uniref:hypothetical protein n=1 Tax=Agrobacterium pusense TaxID=648995 RepID=UPI001C6E597F|nr:hypothetical protein [Agrobacterium pusense]MBW9060319.1 hypothetical protein [Agrobacterium pusense]